MCTAGHGSKGNTEHGWHLVETGLQLQSGTGSVHSSPSHSIEKLLHMTYFLGWGIGKQAWITRVHCTFQDICTSWCSEKSPSRGGQVCQCVGYAGSGASGSRSWYREYVIIHCTLGEHGVTRVWHRLPWCLHCWVVYICFDSAGAVVCQEGQNLQVYSLDAGTKNRHAARDDIGCYTQGRLQAMLLTLDCKPWSCHLHREHWNAGSWCSDFVWKWEAGVPTWVPCSAPRSFFAAAPPADSEQYCGFDRNRHECDHYQTLRWGYLADLRRLIGNCDINWPLIHCRKQNSR